MLRDLDELEKILLRENRALMLELEGPDSLNEGSATAPLKIK